ncbi:MAG: tetratricopeptide repeat protein [Oligoflexus sp.]
MFGRPIKSAKIIISFYVFWVSQVALAELPAVIDAKFEIDLVALLEVSALEPEITRFNQQQEAKATYESLKAQASRMRSNKSVPADHLRSSYREAAAVVHFYSIHRHLDEANAILEASRDWLIDYSGRYQQLAESPQHALIAQYYQIVGEYGKEKGRGGAVTRLIDLRKGLAAEKLIAANVDLMIAHSLLGIQATRQQGRQYLRKALGLSVYGNLGHRLLSALVEANLDAEGNLSETASPDGLKHLAYVAKVARGMPRGIQEPIFNTILFIWEHAYQASNQKPPFDLESASGVPPVDAFIEKQALKHLAAGKTSAALVAYQSLADAYRGQVLEISFQQRIWQIEYDSFLAIKDTQSIEKRFASLYGKYARKRDGSAEYRKALRNFFRNMRTQYHQIVAQRLNEALQATDSRLDTVALVERYLKYDMGRRISFPIKMRLAQLYRKTNQHSRAVDVYLDLAKDKPLQAYTLAAEAQSFIAQWPALPPWQQLPVANLPDERRKLIDIYEKTLALKKQDDWQILAHLGLLQQSLGQEAAMEKLWLERLKNASANQHSQEAGGRLLSGFYQSKRWLPLIQLADLLKQRKINATQNMQNLSVDPLLADALFFQGQDDLQKKNFNQAISYYNQFVQLFANEARIAIVYYNLAQSFIGAGRMLPALNAIKVLIDRFPALENRNQILLQGGQWAGRSQQTVEYAFFFYGKYLREFATAPDIPQVRETLANLYYQRKLYGWAARLYKEQSLGKVVPVAMQLNAALKYMEIEEKFGQPQDAAFGAQRVLQLAAAGSPAVAKAYAFLARYAANRGDLATMKSMEPQLIQISSQSAEGREALGHIRFKMAEMQTRPITNRESNAALRDPEGAIKQYYQAYEVERQHYAKVCQGGISTFCAPSLLRLVMLSQMASEAIRKVEIADTLGPERVNAFNVFKQLHIAKIEEQEKSLAKDSIRLAEQGTTSDLWRSEILKSLAMDRYQAAH